MTENLKNHRAYAALLLTAVLAVTACSNDSGTGAASESPNPEASTAAFNDADVAFAQGMIPHHQQAIEMAQLASDRARSAEVEQLAADIEAAQAPELEQLTTWLEQWGEEVPSEGMDHDSMGHGNSSAVDGMMTEEDMAALEEASGAEFDEMFLEMMVEHHTGAVQMAETEVAEGESADAKALAEEIVSTQNAEIEQMQQLLGS